MKEYRKPYVRKVEFEYEVSTAVSACVIIAYAHYAGGRPKYDNGCKNSQHDPEYNNQSF